MLDIEQQEILNLKALIDKDSTTDESSEGSFTLNTESNPKQFNKKFCKTYKRKSSDVCYALNLFEKYGSLIVKKLNTNNNFLITKIIKVNFPDCKELFEKGKKNVENNYKEGIETVPDITFWHHRYYYYNLFDRGIKMDYESKYNVK